MLGVESLKQKKLNIASLLSPGNETGTVSGLYHLIREDTGKLNFLFFFSLPRTRSICPVTQAAVYCLCSHYISTVKHFKSLHVRCPTFCYGMFTTQHTESPSYDTGPS